MKGSVCFEVPGKPVGKGRPRFNKATGRPYTDKRTRDYQTLVASYCMARMGWSKAFEGPVRVSLWVHTGGKYDGRRHDIDNFEKAVYDGLVEGKLLKNDKQIVKNITELVFGTPGKVDVMVEDVEL